jgi:hypothetical protein
MRQIKFIIYLLGFFSAWTATGQPTEFCMTREEYRLYSRINEYRKGQGLEIVPVSQSLCYVAKMHARDLYHNNPDTAACSLNSWSDKGSWSSCCHSRLTPNPSCIVNKPRELTGFTGEGHELVFWDSQELNADTVLKFWSSIEQARDMLTNQKKWVHFNWKAMGVGLYRGYACVWLSVVTDTLPEPSLCADSPGSDNLTLPGTEGEARNVVTSPTGRHYLIFGSFNSLADARKMADLYREEGFYQAKVVVSDNTYRVSLSDHATQQEALDAKKFLGEKYKSAWTTKY